MKTIIIFILLISSQICNAQTNILWQRVYPGPYDDDDIGYGICPSTDGNYYLAGVSNGIFHPPGFYVIKINPYGQPIWTRVIDGTSVAYTVAATPDGGCVLGGDLARFVKYDANGNLLVNKVLTNIDRQIYNIKRTSDNFYIGCGRYNFDHSLIIKYDSSGNLIWEKVFLSTDSRLLYHIDEAFNGGYIAVGRKSNFFNDSLKLNIVRTDTSGSLIWERDYTQGDGVTFSKVKNYYMITGQRHVTKTDSGGQRFEYFLVNGLDTTTYEAITDMKILGANRYVYSTHIINFSKGEAYGRILISDSMGNPIRSMLFNRSEYTFLSSIYKNNENDFLVFGSTYYDTIPKSNYYAIRTDSMFNIPPVGINNESNLIPNEFALYQNYPNPFNGTTIIKFDILKEDYFELSLFDITGRKIQTLFNQHLNQGKNQTRFTSENLSSGIYFYKLSNRSNYLIKFFLIIK